MGIAQGDLSNEEVAVEVVRQALEALGVDDYETAGLLFGGAPKECFERRRGIPVRIISPLPPPVSRALAKS